MEVARWRPPGRTYAARLPTVDPRRDRALVALVAFTGMRISEAVGADVEDLARLAWAGDR